MTLEKVSKPVLFCFLYFCFLISASSANDGGKSHVKRNVANSYNRVREKSFTENSPASITCNNWLKINSEPSFVKLGDIDVSGNTVTVEALINRTTPWSGGRFYAGDVVSKHTGPSNANYLLRPNTAEITTTNGYFATPQICDIQLNKTYHVALVYDGSTLKFYRNGQLMSSVAATGNLYQNDLMTQIGYMDGNNPGENFIGYINEVRIWKIARTQADIQTYMNSSLPSPTTQTGLVAYYTFDNLLNKQGNTLWNGTLSGNLSINNTNPNCADVKQESCCPILSGTLTGSTTCKNTQPSLTFTSISGQGPYTITYTNGTQTFTQNNVVSGVAFTVPETIQNNTYYSLISIKDANGCSSNVATTTGGNNLIANGDFSQGNTGFTSSYHYTPNNVTEGEYYVGSNSYFWNPNTAQCFDHTSSSGNMMLVNGAPTVNVGVWKQTITVTPNTNYVFSAWIESISPNNPAMLQFSINGTQLGNVFQASTTTCLWQQFYTTWNSGSNTTATISLINQNNIVQGNDFAIDDISFTGIVPVNEKTLVEVTDCSVPPPSFTAPDTVCVNTPVQITNTSTNGTNFFWNFSVADINKTPIGQNLGNVGGVLSDPVFIDIVSDNGKYYGFLTNNKPSHLIRFDFGTSMLNTPVATDLGDLGVLPLPLGLEGIQVVKNNGRWYAIMVGGDPGAGNSPRIVKVDFGTNLENPSPTATNWGNLGNMLTPVDLNIFQENGKYYGFTVNANNNTVTKFDFGTDFNNPPVTTNLGGFGLLNYPTGINAIHENGNWYVFITNAANSTITRLDFGASLNNIPAAVNLGNPGNLLTQPRDLNIMRFCGQLIGFVVNGKILGGATANTLTKLDFNDLITNVPTGVNMGNNANYSFPHSLSKVFREGNDLYTFIPNVDNNTLSRLKFTGSSDVNIPNSPLRTPPPITYSKPGIYNINLLMDEGLPTQSSVCKSILVLPAPDAKPTLDTFLCRGDSLKLQVNYKYGNYLWNTGATDTAIFVKAGGSYSVQYDYYGCKGKDDYTTTIKELPLVNLGIDTSICKNDSLLLDPKNLGAKFLWQDKKTDSVYWVKAAGSYNVKVTDAFGCIQKDTIAVGIFALPNIGLPDSSYYCKYDSLQLDAGKNAVIYSWDNGANTQTTWAKSVGNYIVKVTDANGCINKDTSYISERALPLIDLISDTSICKNDSLLLDAGPNAVKYVWQDGSSKNSFKVKQAGFYKVVITDKYGCSNKDSLTVSTLALPVVNLASNASVCKNDSLLLDAGTNGIKYLWQDGSSKQTIWAKQAGNYVVTVTDANNCTNKDTTALAILQLPSITLADYMTICTGSAAQINASSATGTIYQWTSSPTLSAINISNPVATPTDTTKYYLKVTDANNCSNKDSITVNIVAVPTVAMSKDTAVCIGSSIVLKTQATSTNKYEWTPSTTLDNPSIANPTAKPATKTTYTVKASNDGCASSGQVTVDILPLPTIVKSNDTTICIPNSAQLKASGGVSYKWYPALGLNNAFIANPVATANSSTYFKVLVTDANNCSKLDSVLVKVLPKPEFAIDPGTPALCINDSLLVTASGGDIYQWTPSTNILNANGAAATVFPKTTTDYVVTITNKACNVTDVLTAHIKVNPLPTIGTRKSNDIDCVNPSTNITASGGIEYRWWPAEYLNDPTAISPVATVIQNTEFYVKVIDKNTCSNVDSVMVNVTHDGENLFVVPNAFTPNGDGQNDCFNIRHWGVNNKLIDFSIYDRWGVKVWSSSNIADCWDGTFKGQPQPSGGYVYIIHAKTICGDIVRKGMVMIVR